MPATTTPDAPAWEPRPNTEDPTVQLACGCREGGMDGFAVAILKSRPLAEPPCWRRTWTPHAKKHVQTRFLKDLPNDHPTLKEATNAALAVYREARTQSLAIERRMAAHQDARRDRLAQARLAHQEELDALLQARAA